MTRFRTRAGRAEKIPWWTGCLLVALLAFACPAVANPVLADGDDADAADDELSAFEGPDGVDRQLEYWGDRPSLFAFDPLEPLDPWRDRLEEEHGLAFGLNGYLLYQKSSFDDEEGDDQSLGGVFRLQGSWTTMRDTSHAGRLQVRVEGRDRLGSLSAPSPFAAALGVRALDTGFVYSERFAVDLSIFQWTQTFLDGRIGLHAGVLAFDVHQDVTPFQTIGRAFLNRAVIVNPAIGIVNIGAFGAVAEAFLTDQFWVGAQFYDAAAENGRRFWDTLGDGEFLKNAEIGWTPSRDRIDTDRILLTFWHKDSVSRTGSPSGWGFVLSASYEVWDPFLAFLRVGRNDGDGAAAARTAVTAGFEYTPFRSQALSVAFGWADPVGAPRSEYLVETSYRVQVTPRLSLMPDFQFVVDPAAAPNDDFLFVFSLRTILSF